MRLCELCSRIDFSALPAFPEWLPGFHVPSLDPNLVPFISEGPNVPPEGFKALGVGHHKSLDTLLAAAVNCELCELISRGVLHVVKSRKEYVLDERQRHFDRPGEPTYELRICKRLDAQQGFVVMSPAERNKEIYLVGGVGFCVENGMLTLRSSIRPVN